MEPETSAVNNISCVLDKQNKTNRLIHLLVQEVKELQQRLSMLEPQTYLPAIESPPNLNSFFNVARFLREVITNRNLTIPAGGKKYFTFPNYLEDHQVNTDALTCIDGLLCLHLSEHYGKKTRSEVYEKERVRCERFIQLVKHVPELAVFAQAAAQWAIKRLVEGKMKSKLRTQKTGAARQALRLENQNATQQERSGENEILPSEIENRPVCQATTANNVSARTTHARQNATQQERGAENEILPSEIENRPVRQAIAANNVSARPTHAQNLNSPAERVAPRNGIFEAANAQRECSGWRHTPHLAPARNTCIPSVARIAVRVNENASATLQGKEQLAASSYRNGSSVRRGFSSGHSRSRVQNLMGSNIVPKVRMGSIDNGIEGAQSPLQVPSKVQHHIGGSAVVASHSLHLRKQQTVGTGCAEQNRDRENIGSQTPAEEPADQAMINARGGREDVQNLHSAFQVSENIQAARSGIDAGRMVEIVRNNSAQKFEVRQRDGVVDAPDAQRYVSSQTQARKETFEMARLDRAQGYLSMRGRVATCGGATRGRPRTRGRRASGNKASVRIRGVTRVHGLLQVRTASMTDNLPHRSSPTIRIEERLDNTELENGNVGVMSNGTSLMRDDSRRNSGPIEFASNPSDTQGHPLISDMQANRDNTVGLAATYSERVEFCDTHQQKYLRAVVHSANQSVENSSLNYAEGRKQVVSQVSGLQIEKQKIKTRTGQMPSTQKPRRVLRRLN